MLQATSERTASNILQKRDQNQELSRKNVQILLADLKACSKTGNLEKGKQVHAKVVECGHDSSIYIANALIQMYAKCRSMEDARQIFDSLQNPTVVSWTTLILGYVENGQGYTALDLFIKMRDENSVPDSVTFLAALKACSSLLVKEAADRGRAVHNLVVENVCNSDVYVQSILIDLYAKCGNMVDARQVFDNMKQLTVVTWNSLILGYAENGEGYTALELFAAMDIEPGPGTFVAALKACTTLLSEEEIADCKCRGEALHNLVAETGHNSDIYVQSILIDMYGKSNNMADARLVFDSVKNLNIVSWTALILGYANSGQGGTALDFFCKMRMEGPAPDYVTFVAALKACTPMNETVGGWSEYRDICKALHNLATENGCSSEIYLRNTLLDMYTKCGSMIEARAVFDGIKQPTVVSWTMLILGYSENGQAYTALEWFGKMKTEGPEPDSVTFMAALKACTSLAVEGGANEWAECNDRGKSIQNLYEENGDNSDIYAENTLLDLYAKCANMVDAHLVFESMKHPNVVSWTALILGYAENGQGHTALQFFITMRVEGFAPNSITFMAALKACGLVGALELGRKIHSEIDCGTELDVFLVNCLVDFYAKCGSLMEAQSVFYLHTERNMITWNMLLAGFSSCGETKAVFELFEGMQDAGFQPNGITFVCILTCCSHAGLVEKGMECFNTMCTTYGIIPTIQHYTCMIDLFGRANKLDDAMSLLERMPCSPDDVTWTSILDACRKWKNEEIGALAFRSLISLSATESAGYVLMEQIYE